MESVENISDDIFQCGRCKVAFTSLTMFLGHKREPCTPPSWSVIEMANPGFTYDAQPLETSACGARFEVPDPYDDRRLYATLSTCPRETSVRSDDRFATPTEPEEPFPVTCIQCRKTFKKMANLSVHLRTHAGEKPFQCPVCGRCFSQNTHLQRHIQRHRVWPDGLCDTVPAASDAAIGSYSCSYCDLVLPHYTKFRIHLKSHISKKKFKCIQSECSRLFEQLEPLLCHVRSDHPQQTYSCHICDYGSNTLEDLSKHQQYHHRNASETKTNKNKYNCFQCDASFRKLEKLTFHTATHSHQQTCTRCSKTFSSAKRLRSHLRTHNDTRPFHCSVCGASFCLKKYLTTHLLSHGDRSHVCPVCGLKFKRKDVLDRHRKIHQPLKKLACPFKDQLGCSLQFSRSDRMKLHIKSHVKRLISNKPKSRRNAVGKTAKSTVEIVIIPVNNKLN